jgi:hypothetical protein
MTTLPTVTMLPQTFDRMREFEIVGGAPDVESCGADGSLVIRPAMCRITVWNRPGSTDLDDRVSSYGGTAWPDTWPELFAAIVRFSGAQAVITGYELTDMGRVLLLAAIARADAKTQTPEHCLADVLPPARGPKAAAR